MPRKKHNDFRTTFLLEFTKNLIRSTDTYLKLEIKEQVKEDEKKELLGEKFETGKSQEQKEDLHKKIKEKLHRDKKISSKIKDFQSREKLQESLLKSQKRRFVKSTDIETFENVFGDFEEDKGFETWEDPQKIKLAKKLPIEEPMLPETVRYLRPSPTERELDLGKINPLVNDRLVKTIESHGNGHKVVVTGMMGRKDTPIILNEQEILGIIKKFSDATKIPPPQGFFKVAVGKLIISAVVNPEGSRFVIRKIVV